MLGWLLTVFALLVWGVTFASTRALLVDFSPLEIQAIRFSLAWLALAALGAARRERFRWEGRGEALFAAMGLTAAPPRRRATAASILLRGS